MPETIRPLVEFKHIKKAFNLGSVNESLLFDDFNFSVERGQFISVVGSNGSGKTTLLNLICGSLMPDAGTISLDGHDITRMPEYKRSAHIGRVFQDPMMGTAATMEIEENLALATRRGKARTLLSGITAKERGEYRELLKKLDLGLEDRMTSKVGLLSGGQRQALTLLMATLKKPELLLLDEHTAALDPKTALKVLTLSDQMVQEERLTTLMITHNMKDAIKYGNRLIMMYEGNIIYDVRGEEKRNLHVSDLLAKFEQAIKTLINVPLNQNQFDALVSFTYNLGVGALQRSTLRQKINRAEHQIAASEFFKWVYAGGKRLGGLVSRRSAESQLYLT